MIKHLFTASLLCIGATVSAQTVLGKVVEVQGVVTVSDGITIATAARGTLITQGNRFVTASSGAARLEMDNGCVISLKPNESLLIDSERNCRELIALIQPVGAPSALAVTRISPTLLLAAGGAVLTAGLLGRGGGGSNSGGLGGPGSGDGPIPVVPISGQ